MFRKLKERINECEAHLNAQRCILSEHRRDLTNIYSALSKVVYGCSTVDSTKSNADILLDCVMECKDRTRLFVNGVETIYEVDHDTPIEALYRRIYKAVGFRKVIIYSYEIKGNSVNFTLEARGDTVD